LGEAEEAQAQEEVGERVPVRAQERVPVPVQERARARARAQGRVPAGVPGPFRRPTRPFHRRYRTRCLRSLPMTCRSASTFHQIPSSSRSPQERT